MRFLARLAQIPRSVWALGVVSFFMDTSSELIHGLLPVFLVSVVGASALTVGFIEGLAEATASITKVFSGMLSDYLGKRKFLVVLGYGLAAVTKPLFPLAGSAGHVFAARFIDRIGKGIRGAPRDAILADVTPPELRGASYGLRQAMDTAGAFLGPVLAIVLMARYANDLRTVFWFAVIPAVIAVVVLILFVREPESSRPAGQARSPIRIADLRLFPAKYWWLLAASTVFTLGRFSEAFLVLRAQELGAPLAQIPLVLVVMNAVYMLAAYPAGALADRLTKRQILSLGVVVLIGADLVLAASTSFWQVLGGVAIWGLHMGVTQGVLSAMVADAAPPDRRGSAFGIFHLTGGVATLLASVVAGFTWNFVGPIWTFLLGALLGAASLGLLVSFPGSPLPRLPVTK